MTRTSPLWTPALKKHDRSPGGYTTTYISSSRSLPGAIDQGYHPGPNPARAVRPYGIDQRRRAYSAEEVERILAAARAIEVEARPQDGIIRRGERIVRLLLLTGMPAGELLNLK